MKNKSLIDGALTGLKRATLCLLTGATAVSAQQGQAAQIDRPPRKVIVASVKAVIGGTKAERVAKIDALIASAEAEAEKQFHRPGLDLIVLPESTLNEGNGFWAQETAITADDPAVNSVGKMAKRAGAYIVLPVTLRDSPGSNTCYNAALLLDRQGKVVGTYRKTHPVAAPNGVFENRVTPGRAFPVFGCDFGKLGIQICWDMCYDDGWKALAAAGAEIVALPSASPQTVRPASYAQRFRYWVVSATPRDNATIYNPIGAVDARAETSEVLVHRIDLSSAVVHWSGEVEVEKAFTRAFGERGGFTWFAREDTGLFWSNDPTMPVAAMLRQIGVREMDEEVNRIGRELKKFNADPPL